MIKTFTFPIPQVVHFNEPKHTYLPQHSDTTTIHYETANVQLVDTYLDYHSVLIYRIEAYVSAECILPLKTDKSDFHLLYATRSPAPIVIQNSKSEDQITFPSGHGTYAYVPKGEYDILLHPGHYLVYGLLIDVGFIRTHLFPNANFLHEFRASRKRDKKKLYQTSIWPIKEKTNYQLQRLEEVFFKYHSDHEVEVIRMLYTLFDIAKLKQFKTYEWLDHKEELAKRVRIAIEDQVNQEFSNLSLSGLSEQFGVGHKRLIAIHKRYYKQTLLQYLHQLVIARAKEKLTLYTVSETATYCGYSEVSSFSDFFFKKIGTRPSMYQREQLLKKE